MKIATDSRDVNEPKNIEGDILFTLHKHFDSADDFAHIKEAYEKGGMGYKESKEILIKNLVSFITPMRERRTALARDLDFVRDILVQGGRVARSNAEKKMQEVREKVGFVV
jgi:tryptophanyl-tRNA synthetase